MNNICDIKDISIYLDISQSMLRKLVREKKIPYFRIGNRIKFNIREINLWLKESQEKEKANSIFI